MSRPLLGGGAAAVALLSVSLLFVTQTSVAGTLAEASHELQQKGTAAEIKAPGADVTPTSDATADSATPAAKIEAEASNAAKPGVPTTESSKTDSTAAEPEAAEESALPAQVFTATAYSLRGRTASGKLVNRGLIAADHRVLPLGTRVRIDAGSYSGEYLVADTGGAVRGRKIDIWVPNTGEAMKFGRRPVKLTVLTRTRPRATAQRTSR
jgi:3D (Asp-Asp-Asp) domain-containing protein